jgi:hypothetical protein
MTEVGGLMGWAIGFREFSGRGQPFGEESRICDTIVVVLLQLSYWSIPVKVSFCTTLDL